MASTSLSKIPIFCIISNKPLNNFNVDIPCVVWEIEWIKLMNLIGKYSCHGVLLNWLMNCAIGQGYMLNEWIVWFSMGDVIPYVCIHNGNAYSLFSWLMKKIMKC